MVGGVLGGSFCGFFVGFSMFGSVLTFLLAR